MLVGWKKSFVASCVDSAGMMNGNFHNFHVVFGVFAILVAYKVEGVVAKNWSDDFQPYFGHLNSHCNN
jgi:hypothetical protein